MQQSVETVNDHKHGGKRDIRLIAAKTKHQKQRAGDKAEAPLQCQIDRERHAQHGKHVAVRGIQIANGACYGRKGHKERAKKDERTFFADRKQFADQNGCDCNITERQNAVYPR